MEDAPETRCDSKAKAEEKADAGATKEARGPTKRGQDSGDVPEAGDASGGGAVDVPRKKVKDHGGEEAAEEAAGRAAGLAGSAAATAPTTTGGESGGSAPSSPPRAGGRETAEPCAMDVDAVGTTAAAAASGGTGTASQETEGAGEISFEDMAWEVLPSDHHFVHCTHPQGAGGNRQFLRRVQREWAILQRGLPRGVWVHVYPDRMELLRACLVGPEGTPYSDALFFFDVHLPPTYPQIPPQVRFWSFGENLNPNLYENGKVCLSLLGTWSGKDSETWSPERSNLLQVLVSILGLVLNTEPYYNEPGFERERDTPQGGLRSQRYNESVALSNYHLMLRVLKSPPSDFDRPVQKHFAERRQAILDRARQLREGGGEGATGNCSEGFRKSLAALLPRLEEALPPEAPA
eukprot:TRINITY_DN23824_c0_g1_i1.p1 TRINITY_DN23824_c0_g1~~TRINITY_DN23824_c0_g1_i1.p1  ORF type:complete len:406 (+),score=89.80 TRINITY_DN23824_c0_g1_i1:187-1404(+)